MSIDVPDSPGVYVVKNEVDPDYQYHCDALARRFPIGHEVDFVAGERIPLAQADGVVLSGSTAGVYEADRRPWIAEQEALVRSLVEREIPALGVCFGHQVVNSALGGTVEHVGETAALVEAELSDDPLFDGVDSVFVALNGDAVTAPGTGMLAIASTDDDPIFATRHRSAPLWTVQFHPEVTTALRAELNRDFDWDESEYPFEEVNAVRVLENFQSIVQSGLP